VVSTTTTVSIRQILQWPRSRWRLRP
jgi:hypothetical protein